MIKVKKSNHKHSWDNNDDDNINEFILKTNSLIFSQNEKEFNKNRLKKEFKETIQRFYRDAKSLDELYEQSKDIKWNFELIKNPYIIENGLEFYAFTYTDPYKKYIYRVYIHIVDFNITYQDNISNLLDSSNWAVTLRVFLYNKL